MVNLINKNITSFEEILSAFPPLSNADY